MKKNFFSLLCVLTLLLGAVPFAAALEGEDQRAADTLLTLNLLAEAPASSALQAPATRLQAGVLLDRLSGADFSAKAETALAHAAAQGWILRTVPQDSALSADEWCGALLRVLGYETADEGAALYARRIGLTARDYSGNLTLGDLLQSIRDALTFPCADGTTLIQRLIRQGVCTQSAANALGLFAEELTARQIADRYMSAVFCIQSFDTEKEYRSKTPSGEASGFFITEDGLAVTNYHSIAGSIYANATLVTGETYPIERVLYYDADTDIALLRISRTSAEGSTTPSFAKLDLVGAEDLRPGDTVYTLGNPLGLGLAVSSGMVSAVNRNVEGYALPCVMNTADISKGNSGGALLNIYGRVTAVTSGAYAYGNNMYLAVPVDPILEADWTAEGQTLSEVVKAMYGKTRAA